MAILDSDVHDAVLPWTCDHFGIRSSYPWRTYFNQFLQDNGFTIATNTNADVDGPPVIYAAQEQEGGGYIEYEIEFRAGMSTDEVWEILTNWGVTNSYDYCCYRFGDASDRNFTNWAIWYEQYALTTPPFVVDLIARLVAGPFISLYGYWTHEDAITGEALTGIDYFLNAFDFIPFVGAVSNTVDLGVKCLKFKSQAAL
ncbi:MAG: hypothetical protein IPG07_08455 [Crocinitomicaceae bacterium]|nr:hypothetical protein [Crocinitomicaceae bacterium]